MRCARLCCYIISSLFLLTGYPEAISHAQAKQPIPYAWLPATNGQKSIRLILEIAATEHAREQGLMFRPHLPQDTGMLFIFPESREHLFWMKNTMIPLDMFFLDEAGTIVGVIRNAQPYSLQPRGVGRASRFVLETNAGIADTYGLKVGQTIQLELPHVPTNPKAH